MPMLRSVCDTLDIDRGGKKEEILEKIMNFLMAPKSSEKPVPQPTKKRECRYWMLQFTYCRAVGALSFFNRINAHCICVGFCRS